IMSESKKLTRRQFLKAASGSAAALTALSVPALSRMNAFAAAPLPQDAGEIHLLIRTDIRAAYAVDDAVTAWNEAYPDRPVILDETDEYIPTTVLDAQAAGVSSWDGFAVIEGPTAINYWVNRQLIVPLDDLIAASTVPDADKVVPAIIPSVLEASKFN